MNVFFDQNYNLRYFEMNKHGVASPTTILTLLEETAAEHCHNIGHDLYSLENQNIGWVLISGTIDMIRYPKYKENITIKTWLSKYTLVKGYRENIIYDGDKKIIGKAKGIWAFYDIQKRKPVPIFDDIKNKWGLCEEISAELNLNLIEHSNIGTLSTEFDVFRSDVDSNKHVNNIRYFHYLLETLPEEILDKYYLKTINAKFFTEAKLGDKIKVYINDVIEENTYLHTMKSSLEDKMFVKGYTQWEKI